MNNKTPILSIIVPVFNVAPYLRKCVDSLLAQDYDDYEIILVDDGSTDESGAICDEYANSRLSTLDSPLIRVIHQENRGLSAARNAGLKAAKGEYVCFVDSDDYWEPNVLGGLMEQVERDNLDVLRFDYQNVRIKNEGVRELENERVYEVFEPNKNSKRDVDYSETLTDGETFLNERLGPACYAVMFIIRRDLIISNGQSPMTNDKCEKDNILFTPGIYFEDVDWTPQMLLRAKRVASTPLMVYNYLWRSGSITLPTDPIKRKKVLEDKISLLRGFKEQSKLVKDSKWFTWMTSFTAVGILNVLASMPQTERKLYIGKLETMDIFPLSTKREKMLSHKFKIMLANISPSLYCNLMSLRK